MSHRARREHREHREGPALRSLCARWLDPTVFPMRQFAVVVALAWSMAGASLAQEVIDRVMATVGGQVITLSDVREALALGVVESRPPDADGQATEQLIDRALMLQEVARFAPPEPAPAAVAARIAQMQARFASPAEFDRVAALTGLESARLGDLARDDLRIQAYLAQRFGTSGTPTDDEALRYYRTHRDEFLREGVVIPYEEAAPAARERAASARRRELVADWIAGLRARTLVRAVYKQP